MRRRLALLIVPLLLMTGLGGATTARALSCAAEDDLCNQLNAAQGQSQATADQLIKIQVEITDTQKKMTALFQYIAQLGNQVAAAQAQVDQTSAAIAETEVKIRIAQAELMRRQAHLEVRQAMFDNRVRAVEKHGRVNYMAAVMTSGSFTQLIDRVVSAHQVIDADNRLLADLNVQRDHVKEAQAQLAATRAQQQKLLQQQTQQRNQLQATKLQQQAAYDYQAQLELQYKAQADELARQKKEIDNQVATLQAALDARAKGAGGGTGQFAFPEKSNYYISQGFGCSPYLFEMYWPACPSKHFHSGIDIAGVPRNPVFAADNGIAKVYNTGVGYGKYIIVVHGNGYATLYGHLDSFSVADGATVYRGQQIANEGTTGNSTGYHLHFEIRKDGGYEDPCRYLGC